MTRGRRSEHRGQCRDQAERREAARVKAAFMTHGARPRASPLMPIESGL